MLEARAAAFRGRRATMASKYGRIRVPRLQPFESERVTDLWFVDECAGRCLPPDPWGISEGQVRQNVETQTAKPKAFRTGDG